jgi:hypothetical protein
MTENKTNTINCDDKFGNIKETMEIEALKNKLEEQLKDHDWFYEYSDDHRYYKAGKKEFLEIWETIEEMQKVGENEFDLAIDMYKQYKPARSTPHERVIGKDY